MHLVVQSMILSNCVSCQPSSSCQLLSSSRFIFFIIHSLFCCVWFVCLCVFVCVLLCYQEGGCDGLTDDVLESIIDRTRGLHGGDSAGALTTVSAATAAGAGTTTSNGKHSSSSSGGGGASSSSSSSGGASASGGGTFLTHHQELSVADFDETAPMIR